MALTVGAETIPITIDADGAACVGGTRVTLDTVVYAFEQGNPPEVIVDQYNALSLADVYQVIGYYLRHRLEVDEYLATRKQRALEVRRENEARFNPEGVRERLLARKNQGD
jgi:uncharacterized protein (DUF433 family)